MYSVCSVEKEYERGRYEIFSPLHLPTLFMIAMHKQILRAMHITMNSLMLFTNNAISPNPLTHLVKVATGMINFHKVAVVTIPSTSLPIYTAVHTM